jgi:hypothetical protein
MIYSKYATNSFLKKDLHIQTCNRTKLTGSRQKAFLIVVVRVRRVGSIGCSAILSIPTPCSCSHYPHQQHPHTNSMEVLVWAAEFCLGLRALLLFVTSWAATAISTIPTCTPQAKLLSKPASKPPTKRAQKKMEQHAEDGVLRPRIHHHLAHAWRTTGGPSRPHHVPRQLLVLLCVLLFFLAQVRQLSDPYTDNLHKLIIIITTTTRWALSCRRLLQPP